MRCHLVGVANSHRRRKRTNKGTPSGRYIGLEFGLNCWVSSALCCQLCQASTFGHLSGLRPTRSSSYLASPDGLTKLRLLQLHLSLSQTCWPISPAKGKMVAMDPILNGAGTQRNWPSFLSSHYQSRYSSPYKPLSSDAKPS